TTSTRNVAFVLRGRRPFSVTSPRARSAAASMDDVTVAPRTHVSGRVFGLAAHRTDRPPGLDERLGALDERRRLRAGDGEARRRRLLAFLLDDGLRHDDDALALLVPAQSERGDGPRGLHGLDEVEALRRRLRGRRQLVEHLREIRRQRAHLFLLALQRDELALLAALNVEDPLALRSDRARREVIGRIEIEGRSHLPLDQRREV